MKTYDPVRLERTTINQESMARARRTKRAGLVFGIGLTLAAVLGGCASGAGSSGSLAIPSVAIPSINASAAASAGAQIALGVLDRIDAAIAAAQTSGGLSAENATTLKDLSAKIRTPLQTGDLASAKTAFTD